MKRASKERERRSAAQMHALAAVRREIVLRDSSSGRKYLREYTQAFRSFEKILTTEELQERIARANTLLVGDYHALAASQRYAATLIEQVAPARPVVLCVEAVLSRDQEILNSWWRRELAEDALRSRLRFDRDWGYDWEPFFALLNTARDHAEAIYGLDCMPRKDMRRIRSRDKHAAAKIREAREKHPNAVIMVLFGESHLAPQHLPQLIRQDLPADVVLTVLQNVDALYWQAVGANAGAVSTDADTVCVFNSSPLEKYESYRLCLERWNSDDQTDFAPAVYNVIFSLARTLGFRLDSPHNGTQPRFLADSLPEVVNVGDAESNDFGQQAGVDGIDSREECARGMISKIEDCGCSYAAESNRFFIREFHMAAVAAESARFLLCACRNFAAEEQSESEGVLAHFGSRLLCPEAVQERPNAQGEELYQSYLAGRVSRAAIRRMFLKG